MKVEQLKLYNKYKDIDEKNIEYIYIGVDNYGDYWFIFKNKNNNISFPRLNNYGFNPDKIVKDLNLEIDIDHYGDKYIKGYCWNRCSKQYIETSFRPFLKDKINNIINR